MNTPAFTGHNGLRWRGTPLLPETAKELEEELDAATFNAEAEMGMVGAGRIGTGPANP